MFLDWHRPKIIYRPQHIESLEKPMVHSPATCVGVRTEGGLFPMETCEGQQVSFISLVITKDPRLLAHQNLLGQPMILMRRPGGSLIFFKRRNGSACRSEECTHIGHTQEETDREGSKCNKAVTFYHMNPLTTMIWPSNNMYPTIIKYPP